ncbi:unnamed protein product [Eruca vesicaria subsp. sativa]|uniref:Kinesin motor domain-containing protein n=1 Tax=Eruca vesicaria subsp. sativa TaxID=29727 RepID=A0ABC8KPX8_ERUVS|nr:unnamed protein product [Eruca vesicaria subsp. sativa]
MLRQGHLYQFTSEINLRRSKDSCELDHFKEENENTSLVLSKEIKPLISRVFEGKDVHVIAHGAKCSGKPLIIQGSEWEPETVYDILDQEKRVVSVQEGAQGKIQLRGLSKASTCEVTLTISRAYDVCPLASYEESRKQCSDLAPLEITKINKSIYALQNVMYAINANESHVPYIESNLTHMLKDCLQGSNITLLITYLPQEFSQDDSLYMLNLASQICLGSKRSLPYATTKRNGSARSIALEESVMNSLEIMKKSREPHD